MSKGKTEFISDKMSERILETAGKIAFTEGADSLNVKRILGELGISNRVFYNRFENISSVLNIIYKRVILKMRESITEANFAEGDFYEKVTEMVGRSLSLSYDAKMKLNDFVYEIDSQTESNYKWWTSEIKKLIDYGKKEGYIKDVDSDILSYSIWCFCRGYNADAVSRGLPKDEAIRSFKYSFSFLLEGLKP